MALQTITLRSANWAVSLASELAAATAAIVTTLQIFIAFLPPPE
jgi:hypothetical protein